MTCDQVTAQLDRYALGGLQGDDETQIAHHIATCARCRAALEHARRTAGVLALVTELPQPSAALQQAIASAGSDAEAEAVRPRSPVPLLPRSFEVSLSSVALVFALAAVMIGAMWALTVGRDRAEQRSETARLQAQLRDRDHLLSLVASDSSIDARLSGTQAAPAASGRYYVHLTARQAALVAESLPQLPSSGVYQLWLTTSGGQHVSGGTFTVGSDGLGVLILSASPPLSSISGLEVTIEPLGGSGKPTGRSVLAGSL